MTGWRAGGWALLAGVVLVLGCGGPVVRAPVGEGRSYSRARAHRVPSSGAGYHFVRTGETLYSIAFEHGSDYRALARWNGIGPPYLIYRGQRLQLTPPAPAAGPPMAARFAQRPAVAAPAPPSATQPAIHAPRPTVIIKSEPTREPDAELPAGPIRWTWPAEGRVVHRYTTDATGNKGIEINGRRGEPVRAAAAGRVVYSGNGLLGYGNLVIIKHDASLLSAYAYNRTLLVQQGDRVDAGQKIAEMGSNRSNEPVLHFEIRRDGKPQDPLSFLPKR